jgi:TatD DNase family protein
VIEATDSHCHLQEPEFEDDREAVIERALAAGVRTLIVPGVDIASSERAIALASRHAGVYATAGCHPHEASGLTSGDLDQLSGLLDRREVVAVGEIGLDFYRMLSPREQQLEALEAQLALASAKRMPVVVHCRDAWEEIEGLLRPWALGAGGGLGGSRPAGVLHYFSSSAAVARHYVELGFLISIHTSVTHRRSQELRDVAVSLPLECLLIETDSPYGAPQAFRGKRNEPAYVVEAAKLIAELRNMSIEDIAAATSANARRLFGLEP